VHEVYLDELYEQAARTGRLDEVEVADELAQVFVELRLLRLHNWHTLSNLGKGIEPGPESSVVKLTWTEVTQHLSDTALVVQGRPACSRARGRVSGFGARRRASPAARPRSSERSSPSACSACPAADSYGRIS